MLSTSDPMGLLSLFHRRKYPAGLPPPDKKPTKRSAASRKARRKVVPAPMAGDGAEQTWIVIGCDFAGKSTLIAGLNGQTSREEMIPTFGFSKSNAALGKHRLRIFDVGGGAGIRGIWQSYYADVHGVIFVVDATETVRFEEARELLHAAYAHAYLVGKPLLVVANKSDLPKAVGADALADALQMHALAPGAHRVCRAALLSDDIESKGVAEGIAPSLLWLTDTIHTNFEGLQERCAAHVAEQDEADRRKKEERKARLAAKRLAREKEEAEEAAGLAQGGGPASGDAAAAPVLVPVPPATVPVPPPSPAPSPPSSAGLPAPLAGGTPFGRTPLPVLDYFSSAASLERAPSSSSEMAVFSSPRQLRGAQLKPLRTPGSMPTPLRMAVESC